MKLLYVIQSESFTRKAGSRELFRARVANSTKLIVGAALVPLWAAFTSRMVRNHGAWLLEDSPTRASPEPQVRSLAPCFTVRSPDRDMTPDIRAMCHRPHYCSGGSLVDIGLGTRRGHRARLKGTARSHLPPNRPQITTLGPT